MNKMSVVTALNYEEPELLECFPDIDYEMLPIRDEQRVNNVSSNSFHIQQLSHSGMKTVLKEAKKFEVITKAVKKASGSKNTQVSDEIYIAISGKASSTVLLLLDQIKVCKKSKKYTKIILEENQELKTSIPFKKLKKSLIQYGFTKYQKRYLVRDKLNGHSLKASNPN